MATGLLAGIYAAMMADQQGETLPQSLGADSDSVPLIARATALGSLTHYITHAEAKNFQPANITFDLLPRLEEKNRERKLPHQRICEQTLTEFDKCGNQVVHELRH